MKFIFLLLASSSLLLAFNSCGQSIGNNPTAGAEHAPRPKPRLPAPSATKPPFFHPLLQTKASAIAVAEPILFSIYGQENIIRQRPYKVWLEKGAWYLSGTLPASAVGGTFYLVIEASNCRVQTLFHTK